MSDARVSKPLLSLLLPLLILAFIPQTQILGQQRYTPQHPEVQQMVERAMAAISIPADHPDSGQLILLALAYTEGVKRYEERIPKEHPLVKQALDRVTREFEFPRNDSRNILNGEEVYYMCLASILMCECDAVKYKNQIQSIIDVLVARQQSFGAFTYTNKPGQGDTSQSQFAGLALWIAKYHKFNIPLDTPKNCLEWYVNVMLPEGTWFYIYQGNRSGDGLRRLKLSIHAASLSTVYLFADVLQLNARAKGGKAAANSQWKNGLPPSISIYVPPKDGDTENDADWSKEGPLVSFDTAALRRTKTAGNKYLVENFTLDLDAWKYYYIYALERYAYFREKSEGSVREIPDWYDQGVDYLKTKQQTNGAFERGRNSAENSNVASAFSILFLVRASELLILPPTASKAGGNLGFQENVKYKQSGTGDVTAVDAVKGVNDVVTLLNDSELDEQSAELITSAMGLIVQDFQKKKGKSRNEQTAFLRGLMKDRNYFRRLVAVKVLARTQDFDSAPALIYALGDPDTRIAIEAHNGLRLISRKLKSISVPAKPTLADFKVVKRSWSDWYLTIRPGAELWD